MFKIEPFLSERFCQIISLIHKNIHMKSIVSLVLSIILIIGCKSTGNQNERIEDIQEHRGARPDQPVKEIVRSFHDDSTMVYFPGGEIQIGAESDIPPHGPPFQMYIKPFYLDIHPVTVSMFRRFIEETGYRTDAEKFGNSGVFDPKRFQWELVEGANWKYPFGKGNKPAQNDHPVTHVSWNDAVAYCQWAGKRLPTEFEWEYAARNGRNNGNKYPWGNEIRPGGKYTANYWQGDITDKQGKDGFIYTSPAGYYGALESGLTDMAGNVWEWCSNPFSPYPNSGNFFDIEPNSRAIRGGSFFYDQAGEESLAVYFRSSNTIETSLFNMGFRCAADASEENK